MEPHNEVEGIQFETYSYKVGYNKKSPTQGFTLIELLVVVAIIGLLSSVVLASLNTARSKARDTARKSTLKQLQNALELYFDTNNAYPSTGGATYSSEPGDTISNNGGNWIPGLTPTYISSLPRDPRGGASLINPPCASPWKSAYTYLSNGTNYKLNSHCAPENAWTSNDPFYDPWRSNWAWMATNKNDLPPGGSCTGYNYPSIYPVCW